MIDEIERIIKSHMENQPYKSKCDECGKDINCYGELDRDLDMTINVSVCDCMKDETAELKAKIEELEDKIRDMEDS